MELQELNHNEMKEINGGAPLTVGLTKLLKSLNLNLGVPAVVSVSLPEIGLTGPLNDLLNMLSIGPNGA